MNEKLQVLYAEKCKYALHLFNLGFPPKMVDGYYISHIQPGIIILDLGNNTEFHYSSFNFKKWWVE